MNRPRVPELSRPCLILRGPSLVLVLTALLGVREARATTAADVPCQAASPPPAPCVVGTFVPVTSGSTLDFGTRGLVLTSAGELNARGGSMSILAASLDLRPGALLVSAGGTINVTTTGAIQVEAADVKARISVSGAAGGSITVVAGGDLVIVGSLLALPTTVQGGAGSIDVTGASVTVAGKLSVAGGDGDLSVSASDTNVVVSGTLDASGPDGGCIDVEANGDVITTSSASLDVRSGPGGIGGEIDITADNGNATLGGAMMGTASASDTSPGAAADVSIMAAGTIASTGAIDMHCIGPNGSGGFVEFLTAGDIVVSGAIDASAPGTGAGGGEVDFTTGTGAVELRSDISADGPGGGGRISAFSFNDVRVVSGSVVADGPGEDTGVSLQGCGVSVAAAARLSSLGAQGTNHLQASGAMQIAGPLVAGESNLLEYLVSPPTVLYPPAPPPDVTRNPNLFPCGGPASTTTTTPSTSTTTMTGPGGTTTTVSTTTSTSPPPTTATTAPTSTSSTVRLTTTSTTSVAEGAPATPCAPADCDDGDPCTDDRCDSLAGCVHDPRSGLDGVACYLDAIASTLIAAPVDDVGGPRLRSRFKARITKVHHMMDAARKLAGTRRTARLRRADRVLGSFIHAVQQGDQSGKVAHAVAERLLRLAAGARSSLQPLTR